MPVYRYKTHEEAHRALWLEPGDPRIFRRLRALLQLTNWLVGEYIPPRGVFKFRTIEEANAHREAWEQDRINKIRERNEKLKQKHEEEK